MARFGWDHYFRWGSEEYEAWRKERGFGERPAPTLVKTHGGTQGYEERAVYAVVDEPSEAWPTARVYGAAAEYLEKELSSREPWCLFVSTNDPHDPYIAPREFYEMYDWRKIPKPENFDDDMRGKPNIMRRIQRVWDGLTWEDFAKATCPTVLELAGIEPFETCHFRSLAPLLRDPDGPGWQDEAYAEFHGGRFYFTQRILWRNRLKYIMNAFDYDEMYDLEKDPGELRNVAEDPAYVVPKEEMLRGIWRKIHDTGDTTLAKAEYFPMRIFDLRPGCLETGN